MLPASLLKERKVRTALLCESFLFYFISKHNSLKGAKTQPSIQEKHLVRGKKRKRKNIKNMKARNI